MPLIVFITSARCFRSKADLQRILLSCSLVGIGLSAGALYNWSRFQSGAIELDAGLAAKDMVQMSGLRSNAVGGTAAMLLPGALYALWHANLRWRLIGLVSLLGLCATIIFSMSRGSMIAAIIGVGVSLILRVCGRSRNIDRKATWTLIAIAMAVFLGWQLFPAQLKFTLLTQIEIADMQVSTPGETNGRFTRWEILMHRSMKNPQGVGVGNYESLSAVQDARLGGSAHNLYLETLEEEGWLGLATLLLGLAYAWRAGRKMLSTQTAMEDEWTVVNVAWLVYLVNVAVEPNYFSVQFTYIFWIIVGAAAAAGAAGGRQEDGEAGSSGRVLAKAC
jgi:O-antigen ligase